MKPFPIRSDADHMRALALVESLWNAEIGSADAALLDTMAERIQEYEAVALDRLLPPANPRVVIAAKLRELRMSQRALAKVLGWGSGRVSEVISGKRALTLAMVRALAPVLGIDPGLLVADCATEEDAPVVVRVPRALVLRAEHGGYCGYRSMEELVAAALASMIGPTHRTSTDGSAAQALGTSPANNALMFLAKGKVA